MTPGARTQAAIELLDAILNAAREGGAAADTLVARYFATRRYAGSKDRRAVRALVYDAIRMLGEVPASGRAAMLALVAARPDLAESFDGSPHGPPHINPTEVAAVAGVAPRWLVDALTASGIGADQQAALLDRAPLDLRINPKRTTRAAVIAAFPGAGPVDGLPDAVRLPPDSHVEQSVEWQEGHVEVQDAGSQLVALAVGAKPGDRVIDLCAGAGGKTLALAAAMADQGAIIACDTDRGRLSRLPQRAARAGVSIATTRLLDPNREVEALADLRAQADCVMIDAPCSGTGTWRRNPESRWRLTPDRLDRLVVTQARLLDIAAELVRPGGTLSYVVCSLLDAEGADQVAAFVERHGGWMAERLVLPRGTPHGSGMRLTPARDATDGFYVARLVRAC